MRQRYGLREAPPSTDEETAAKLIGRIFRKLLKRSSREKNKNNLSHPARWVVQDKEKFVKLIEDLKSLNDIFEDTVASHARLSTYRRELYKKIQTCADTDALEMLSTAYMGNENGVFDVASQQLSALEDQSSRMEPLVAERGEYSNAQKTHLSPKRGQQQSTRTLRRLKISSRAQRLSTWRVIWMTRLETHPSSLVVKVLSCCKPWKRRAVLFNLSGGTTWPIVRMCWRVYQQDHEPSIWNAGCSWNSRI